MQDMAVKGGFLYLPQFQCPQVQVISTRLMLADDFLPGGFQYQVHLLHPHIGNPVNENLNIRHQPPEVFVGGDLTQQPVVDCTAT